MHPGVREFIRWLDANRHEDRVRLNPPATEPEIAAIEHRLGMPLPADLRMLFKYFNGGTTPVGQLLAVGDGENSIERELSRYARTRQQPANDPELLLPFHRTLEGSILAFDRAAGPLPDTWPIVDYFEDTGEERLVHRTLDGWCRKCVADWNAPDFDADFTLESYLQLGLRHAKIEPDVASAHATVAHALKRCGRPEDALARYLTAARCEPPLEWCDWEALKLSYILCDHASAFEAAVRLSSRAPASRWVRRETTPGRVAELVGALARDYDDPAPWLNILGRLVDQASEEEAVLVRDIQMAVMDTARPMPTLRPSRTSPAIALPPDPDEWWENAVRAYRRGEIRDLDIIFDPSLIQLNQARRTVDLLRIRREFE